MLVLTPTRLILIVVASCVLLPPLLGLLAKNRGRTPLNWALLGALPLFNIAALIILLWTPLLAEQEAARLREEQWREAMKNAARANPAGGKNAGRKIGNKPKENPPDP